jgi:hypothetical protein
MERNKYLTAGILAGVAVGLFLWTVLSGWR